MRQADWYKDWKANIKSWMRKDEQIRFQKYLDREKKNAAKKLRRRHFHSYVFHLAGSRRLLHLLIQTPILDQCKPQVGASDTITSAHSAEQPAKFIKLIKKLRKSATLAQEKLALGNEIAQHSLKLATARNLAKRIDDPANPLEPRFLTYQNRMLVRELRTGRLQDDARRLLERQAALEKAGTGNKKHLPQKRKR